VVIALTLAACGSQPPGGTADSLNADNLPTQASSSQVFDDTQKAADAPGLAPDPVYSPESALESEPAITVATANVLSVDREDPANGYTWTSTVALTDWIRGSDTEAVAAAWAAIGGNGAFSVPTIAGGAIANGGSAGGGLGRVYNPQKVAVAFGTMSVKNTTEGFSLDTATESVIVDEWQPNVVCIQRSDGLSCDMSAVFIFSTPIDSGSAATRPFVVIAGDAFTPADPDGQGVLSAVVSFGLAASGRSAGDGSVTSMTLGKTW
jgi:hypothetical protein